MGKQIFADIVGRDETVALGVVKPLYSTSCHTPLPLPLEKRGPDARRLFEIQVRVIGKTGTAVGLKPNTNPLFRLFILGSQVCSDGRKHLLQRGFKASAAVREKVRRHL